MAGRIAAAAWRVARAPPCGSARHHDAEATLHAVPVSFMHGIDSAAVSVFYCQIDPARRDVYHLVDLCFGDDVGRHEVHDVADRA